MLKVEESRSGLSAFREMKITGFTRKELDEMGSMSYDELLETVLERVEQDYPGTPECWKCGYGIYGLITTDSGVYISIGKSCD